MKTNVRLANGGLSSLVKEATCGQTKHNCLHCTNLNLNLRVDLLYL